MDITDFFQVTYNCKNTEQLTKYFISFIECYGYNKFLMARMSSGTTAEKEKNFGLLLNFPTEWIDRYLINHYINHDPIYNASLKAKNPFTWEEILSLNLTKKELKIMQEANKFDLKSGLCITIRPLTGGLIAFSLSSSTPDKVCTDITSINMIEFACKKFYETYKDLNDSNVYKNESLTKREKEILHWLSKGKTREDIAIILEISNTTVNQHCNNIFNKLEVNSAILAVVKAINSGIIIPD